MIFVNGADLRRDRVIFVEVGAMESLRTTYDSDDEAQSYKKPGVRLEDVGNDADDEGVDDEPAATLSERALSPSMPEPLPEPLPASVAAVATHQESPPTPPVAELADGPQCLPAVPPRAHEVLCSSERADEAVCLPARRQREPTLFLEVDSEEASEPAESDNSDSDFDHGSCVHELRSGRYSKLEGCFYGADTMGDLTLHSQFVAAANASSGYKSLARGMWVDCPGVPWEETQLVRIDSVARLRKVRRESLKRSTLCCFMLAINNRTDGTTPPCSSLSRWMTVFSLAKEAYSMAKTAGYAMTIATVPTKPYRSGHHSQLVRSQGRQES